MLEEECRIHCLIDYLKVLYDFYIVCVDDQLEEIIKESIKVTSEEIESLLISPHLSLSCPNPD